MKIIMLLQPIKNWLPWQRPLRDQKTNYRSFIYSQSSINPVNLAKIGLVDVEIIGLTEIIKDKEKIIKKQRQNISPPLAALRAARPG